MENKTTENARKTLIINDIIKLLKQYFGEDIGYDLSVQKINDVYITDIIYNDIINNKTHIREAIGKVFLNAISNSNQTHTKVYGYNDDCIEIKLPNGKYKDLDAYDTDWNIKFDDGTIISITYTKSPSKWEITVKKKGTAMSELKVCENITDHEYTDIFRINATPVFYRKSKGGNK